MTSNQPRVMMHAHGRVEMMMMMQMQPCTSDKAADDKKYRSRKRCAIHAISSGAPPFHSAHLW